MKRRQLLMTRSAALAPLVAALVFAAASLAAAQTETVIHTFQSNGKKDGAGPSSGLVADSQGSLYGVTGDGGEYGRGTVYKLTADGSAWKETILYSFTGGIDGSPSGSVLIDNRSHEIYGTTAFGGAYGYGSVYELTPGNPWTLSVLYSFRGHPDGIYPIGGVIADASGALYGVDSGGGRKTDYGAIFRLAPPTEVGGVWTEKIIYIFTGGTDGAFPNGGLIFGSDRSLYGTTINGTQQAPSFGSAFKLSPPSGPGFWTLTTLYTFTGGTDGGAPSAGLIFDSSGALYGTTSFGGDPACVQGESCGTVFKLTLPSGGSGAWTESVLYAFTGGSDGAAPEASLIFDSTGALYSTTIGGGEFSSTCGLGPGAGCGTVFKVTPPSGGIGAWTESVLYAFQGGSDGDNPVTPLLMLGSNLYGTTQYGGVPNSGTVFEVIP
jgi:uncharacterized repeat protein (TIGR03803 family)